MGRVNGMSTREIASTTLENVQRLRFEYPPLPKGLLRLETHNR